MTITLQQAIAILQDRLGDDYERHRKTILDTIKGLIAMWGFDTNELPHDFPDRIIDALKKKMWS